jgi:hypothetical protein
MYVACGCCVGVAGENVRFAPVCTCVSCRLQTADPDWGGVNFPPKSNSEKWRGKFQVNVVLDLG